MGLRDDILRTAGNNWMMTYMEINRSDLYSRVDVHTFKKKKNVALNNYSDNFVHITESNGSNCFQF